MTDNVKHSTSYFHEVVAKAFEMFKNGYEPVMETPFQPRRQGSAFVVEYKLVRESLDFDGSDESYMKMNEDALKLIQKDIEDGKIGPMPADLLERMAALREKAESNRAMDELAEQAQKLDMSYDKQLTIQEKWEIDDHIEHEAIGEPTGNDAYFDPLDTEGGEKELAESESCGKLLYSKEQLDVMHWSELKPLLDEAGIKGRRRQNLIRDFLKKQEEQQ